MFDVHSYLRDEFRRYYPDADRIDVHVLEDGEAYDVGVVTMGGSHIRNFHMDVGSDDDCFWFVNTANGNSLTIPFAPDQYIEAMGDQPCATDYPKVLDENDPFYGWPACDGLHLIRMSMEA